MEHIFFLTLEEIQNQTITIYTYAVRILLHKYLKQNERSTSHNSWEVIRQSNRDSESKYTPSKGSFTLTDKKTIKLLFPIKGSQGTLWASRGFHGSHCFHLVEN